MSDLFPIRNSLAPPGLVRVTEGKKASGETETWVKIGKEGSRFGRRGRHTLCLILLPDPSSSSFVSSSGTLLTPPLKVPEVAKDPTGRLSELNSRSLSSTWTDTFYSVTPSL